MKLLLAVLTLASTLLSIQCRPQTIQIEKQVIRLAVPEPSGRTLAETQFLTGDTRRGSTEETDRILREIERINVAMGYKKKAELAFPRSGQAGPVAGYFYPRPAYYPPSLAQVKQQPIGVGTSSKASKGIAKPIAIDPFRAQSFFYPAPYLQLPTLASPRAFQLVPLPVSVPVPVPAAPQMATPATTETRVVPAGRASKDLRSGGLGSDQIYILPISVPSADGKSSEIRYIPSTVNFGSFSPIQLRGKALRLQQQQQEEQQEVQPVSKPKKAKGVMEDVEEVADAVQSTKLEEELLEEIVEAVDYEEDDEERLGGQRPVVAQGDVTELPAITNDKFMGNGPAKQKVNEEDEEEEDEESDEESEPDIELQVQMLQKSGAGSGKSFNITNVFNNFTHRFSILPTTTPATTLTELPLDELDLKEKPLGSSGSGVDEELPAQDKGPFGFLATKQADPAGTGVVIQRLRVRQGGIAIAGPGGVATAGSGGTAIVGPNGTAITHPRSLTIAGPGAKIYAVPESVDLAKTVQAQQRSLPLDAVLVASGPVVYYRT